MFKWLKKTHSNNTVTSSDCQKEYKTVTSNLSIKKETYRNIDINIDKNFNPDDYIIIKNLVQTLFPKYSELKKRHIEIISLLNNFNLKNSVLAFTRIKEQLLTNIDATKLVIKAFNETFNIAVSNKTDKLELSESFLCNLATKANSADLKILIVGQFKQGKSTLINALLGEKILPAFSTPCTAVITELKYGEQKKAILHFKQNISKLPSNLPSNVKKHLKKHDLNNIPPLDINIYDLESCLVISDPNREQEQSVAESPYARCEIYWPLELCKNGVTIIDSPGLNEAESREKTTMNYMDKVDMIIHVLNCQQLAGKYDQDFIDTAKNYGFENLIFACNRFDQLNTDNDRVQVKKYAYQKLINQTSLGKKGIYFISSYPALNAKIHQNNQEYINSGFAEFEANIGQLIIEDRAKIKIQPSIIYLANEIDRFLKERIDPLEKLLNQHANKIKLRYDDQKPKITQLENQIQQLRTQVKSKIQKINTQITTWIGNFIDDYIGRIPAIISAAPIKLAMEPKEMNDVLNQYMCSHLNKETSHWINNTLIPRLQTETEILQRDIHSQAQNISLKISALNRDLCVTTYQTPIRSSVSYLLKPTNLPSSENNNVIGISIIAGLTVLIGCTTSILLGLIGGFALCGIYEQKQLNKIKTEFAYNMQIQMKQKRIDFINSIACNCITSLYDKIKLSIEDAEKSLLAIKRNLETAMIQTRDLANKTDIKKKELLEYKKLLIGIKQLLNITHELIK